MAFLKWEVFSHFFQSQLSVSVW